MKPLLVSIACTVSLGLGQTPPGFTSLFNGRDLSGWKIPAGDNGHWKVAGGVIDYDARSEAAGNKSLYTEKQFGDFLLRVDWRIKETPYINPNARIILPDGSYKLDEKGKPISIAVPDSDSGILLRGGQQINIWCWPVGSGEMYSLRLNQKVSPAIRAAATPKVNADRNIGEWNSFEIEVRGKRVTVHLNGRLVIDGAEAADLPERGPIGLQHHGSWDGSRFAGPPSLVQFRNIYIKEL